MTTTWGGWTFGVNLNSLINEALWVHAHLANYNHLGSDATAYQTALASMVNEAIEEYLDRNPMINIATPATQAVTDGTAAYNIPTSLRGADILSIAYSDSGSDPANDCRELQFVSPAVISSFPPSYKNGDLEVNNPDYWGFDIDKNQIVLYPYPGASSTLVITYRAEPTAITQANIATPSAVSIGEIPGFGITALALRLAQKMRQAMPDAYNQQMAMNLSQLYELEMEKNYERITRTGPTAKPGGQTSNINRHTFYSGFRRI